MQKLKTSDVNMIRGLCDKRFKYFVQCFIGAFGGYEAYDPSFHGRICDFLQDSPAPDKLVICPRSHLKTTIVATLYPLWRASVNPNIRNLIVSNSEPNASKTIHQIKSIPERSKLYNLVYKDRIPKFTGNSRWSDTCACLKRDYDHPEGTFEAAGTGTTLIRRHYDLQIEDDTVAPKRDSMSGGEMMPSRDDVEKALGFHKLTVPLFVHPLKSQRIFICTRWAAYDVANYIMEHETNKAFGRYYDVLDIHAYKEDGTPSYNRFDGGALDAIKATMGSFMFNMLYLNNPLSSEFMKFRPEWIRYWTSKKDDIDDKDLFGLPKDGIKRITVDPADPPTGKGGQCFTVALAALNCASGLYVLDVVRGKFTNAQLIHKTLDLADKWDISWIRIEADRYPHLKAAFQTIINKRFEDTGNKYYVEDVKTRGRNKEERIMRLQPLFEEGSVYLRKNMNELENELFQFPRGTTKDIIDALAWQVLDDFRVPKKVKKEVVKEELKEGEFTLDMIRKSMRGKSKYPFARHNQAKRMVAAMHSN